MQFRNTEVRVASALQLSLYTVEYHREELYNRLGIEPRKQLVELVRMQPELD